MPHLELAHQPFRKSETYNDQLGELARKNKGDESWNERLREAVTNLDGLFFFDHLYIGGGNTRRVDRDGLGDVLRARHYRRQHGGDPGRCEALGGRMKVDSAMAAVRSGRLRTS